MPDIIQIENNNLLLKVDTMANTCRYVVNALGKGGETYYTLCKDKQELQNWITTNQEKLIMEELQVTDKNQTLFSKLFNLKKLY
jgi:uncharacterized cysteine cluster protein YcgN (CxxCxxCC family)